jgi:hypothetical protein
VGDLSHSQLVEKLGQRAGSPDLDSVLAEVAGACRSELAPRAHLERPSPRRADRLQPRAMAPSMFRLKPALWAEFDPFYVHFNQRDRSTAEQRAMDHWAARQRAEGQQVRTARGACASFLGLSAAAPAWPARRLVHAPAERCGGRDTRGSCAPRGANAAGWR